MLAVNSLQLLKSICEIPEMIQIRSQIETPNADEIKNGSALFGLYSVGIHSLPIQSEISKWEQIAKMTFHFYLSHKVSHQKQWLG